MNYCEHCQGQRFDRARVLRALRQLRLELRQVEGAGRSAEAVLRALDAVRALEIPHLEPEQDDDQVVH